MRWVMQENLLQCYSDQETSANESEGRRHNMFEGGREVIVKTPHHGPQRSPGGTISALQRPLLPHRYRGIRRRLNWSWSQAKNWAKLQHTPNSESKHVLHCGGDRFLFQRLLFRRGETWYINHHLATSSLSSRCNSISITSRSKQHRFSSLPNPGSEVCNAYPDTN